MTNRQSSLNIPSKRKRAAGYHPTAHGNDYLSSDQSSSEPKLTGSDSAQVGRTRDWVRMTLITLQDDTDTLISSCGGG